MRVLHINASYKPAYIYGGPTMSVSMLCEQMAAYGVEITVFTTTANGEIELPVTANTPIIIDGVTVIYFSRVTKDHTHFSPALLIRLWKDAKKYDIVHIHAWWNLVSVLGCLVAFMRGVPVIISPRGTLSNYSFHTNNTTIKQVIHSCLGKPLLKRCTIHVTSKQEKDALLQLIKPIGLFILPNLIKPPVYNTLTERRSNHELKLIFFSRVEAKKGLDILLNALPLVNIPFSLTIAGGGEAGYIEHLKNIARDHNLTAKINWVGFLNENKFEVLANHDLFVLPSYDENFGNAVIESLAVGTAVLISDKVGLKDYLIEKKLGWVCETTAAAFADVINTISFDELRKIRNAAPAIIDHDFTPENLTRQYLAQYTQIINNG